MSLQKRTLALSVTLLLILSVLFLGGARMASAAFQTADSGMPFVSAVFHSDNLDNRQSGEVEFTGDIQAIGSDTWTIGGLVVNIQPGTEFKGSFVVGDQVKVHVFRDANGGLFAQEISPLSAGSVELTNDNTNEGNENESMWEDNSNSNETINENDDYEENDNEGISNGNSNANSNDDNSNSSINEDDDNGNDDRGDDHGNTNGNTHDDDHEEHSSINWNQ